jgi:hypothetical protein
MQGSKSAKLVDETPAIPYLCGTMTRHFFALLALLTGLAALGSPAQASLAEVLACNFSIAAAAGEEATGSENAAVQPAPTTLRESRAVAAPAPRPVRPEVLRLPVLMGIERAYE